MQLQYEIDKKAIGKLIEEASVPESELAANMLAQLEADMDGGSNRRQEKKPFVKVLSLLFIDIFIT